MGPQKEGGMSGPSPAEPTSALITLGRGFLGCPYVTLGENLMV